MRIRVLIALAGFAAAAFVQPALADGRHVRERVRSGEVRPLDQILPRIHNQYPGDFYDAEGPMPGPDGRPNYRIKWLTPDGRVVWFHADAQSGQVIGIEGRPRGWQMGGPFPSRPGMRPGRYYGPWGGWGRGGGRGFGGHGRRGR